MSSPISAAVPDPLAGIPRPQGDVWAVFERARAFTGAGNELTSVRERLNGSVDSTVGGTWIGAAGSSCRQAVSEHAADYAKSGGYALEAGSVLAHCANQWQAALAGYDQARTLADEAIADEIAYRERAEQAAYDAEAAGNEAHASVIRSDAETHQSPDRFAATRKASAAVHEFNAATKECCGKLDALMIPLQAVVGKGGLAVGTGMSGVRAYYKYGSQNWTKTIHGQWRAPDGSMFSARAWKPHSGLEWVPGKQVADDAKQQRWGGRARWLGRAGYGLSFATAGASQWVEDGRKYPAMETDERVSRAAAQGLSTGLGGAAAGAVAGAVVGSAVPVFGTAVGFVVGGVVGYFASREIDKHNDWFVDGAGNIGDEAGDRLGEAWDAIR